MAFVHPSHQPYRMIGRNQWFFLNTVKETFYFLKDKKIHNNQKEGKYSYCKGIASSLFLENQRYNRRGEKKKREDNGRFVQKQISAPFGGVENS